MNGLILLANGFEDTEALTTRDVLLRAGLKVTTASINNNNIVASSFGITLLADTLLSNIKDFSNYDFIVLPGGGKGTQNLIDSSLVKDTLIDFYQKNKLICTICAAPSVLGKYGFLKNKKYTCFAGFNSGIEGNFTGNEIEIDGNIITGRSMMYSIDFGLTIVDTLLGKEAKERVLISLKGQTIK